MQESSRIAAGRRKAVRAKRTVALAAAGSFLAVLGLARATHPGSAAAGSGSTLSPPTALVRQTQAGSSLSSGTIAPSTSSSQPQVQTSTS